MKLLNAGTQSSVHLPVHVIKLKQLKCVLKRTSAKQRCGLLISPAAKSITTGPS